MNTSNYNSNPPSSKNNQILNPFDYNFNPTSEMLKLMEEFRLEFRNIFDKILKLQNESKMDGRYSALAKTHLEEVSMWINKAITHIL